LFLAVVGLTVTASLAQETKEPSLATLTAKDSPLREGEAIAFLGDSITQQGAGQNGYVWLIEQAVAKQRPELKAQIIKAGISGHKVPDLQARLDRDVLGKRPTAVFIYIGINDVWHSERGRGTDKDKYEAGLRDLIARIEKAGAVVVLATPSVIGEKNDGANKLDKMLDEYAAISRKVAADTKVTLCDLHADFQTHLKQHNKDNKDRGILTTDGVHLNGAGNALVAERAAASLAAALKNRK
jgi:lysophospholipase L1-like esterase